MNQDKSSGVENTVSNQQALLDTLTAKMSEIQERLERHNRKLEIIEKALRDRDS